MMSTGERDKPKILILAIRQALAVLLAGLEDWLETPNEKSLLVSRRLEKKHG